MTNFRTLLKISRPLLIFLAALNYALGAAIAYYFRRPFHAPAFWLGILAVLALLVAAFLLAEYFRLPFTPLAQGETPRQRERLRTLLMQVSAAALVLATGVLITLLYSHLLSLTSGILIALTFLLLVSYAVPPFRLAETGFGELVLSVTLATIFPAISFFLQTSEYSRLLTMTTFPLTLLALAYFLILDFPTFAIDQRMARRTLLARLTWQRAIPVHHLLVLLAFLIFASAPYFGFPWRLIWPVFLSLPFAIAQILWLQHIAGGGRTLWRFLTGLAAGTFGLAAYLLAFTFWIR